MLLSLQRTAGNRAVRQLVAREPDEAGAGAERDIREFEATLGHPLSTEDREAMYKYLQAKRGEGPAPRRVDVTPSMFGDAPQEILERSLLLGPFNVIPERVHLPHEPGYTTARSSSCASPTRSAWAKGSRGSSTG